MTIEQAESYVMPFGKHNMKTMKEILECDPTYILWLSEQANLKSVLLQLVVARMMLTHQATIEDAARFRRAER